MADRTLDLSLTCEKYSDGSPYTIAYSEERSDPDLIEQFSPEGSGCTRTFYTAWADRFNFIENMVGFAKVNNAGSDGIAADTSWDGRHIHRKLPVGYHMGLTDTSAPPVPTDWVYATRAVAMPDGAKANEVTTGASPTMSKYEPKATYAKIMVTFAALDYDLYSDSQVWNGGGSGGAGGVGCMREWLRYARIVQKPANVYFKSTLQWLKLVDYPNGKEGGALGTIDYNDHPNVLDNVADLWLYLYDLPYDPIAAINLCFGRVNSTAIFPTPDFTEGQPAETLQLIAADIVRQPLRMSRRYWNVQFGFRKVYNVDNRPTSGGAIVGHNHRRWITHDAGGVTRLRFYRVSADGTNVLTPGNPLYDVVDFRKLFWIPATNIQPPALPAGP